MGGERHQVLAYFFPGTADFNNQAIMGYVCRRNMYHSYTPCPFSEATMPALDEAKAPWWTPTPEEIADAEVRWQEHLKNPQPPAPVAPICTVW